MNFEKNFFDLLRENLDLLQRHSKLFFTIFLGVFLIAVFFTFRTPKVYEAKTTFYFPMQAAGGGGGADANGLANSVLGRSAQGIFAALLPTPQVTMQNYAQGILESRWIANQLIDRFNLMPSRHAQFRNSVIEALRQATQIRLNTEGIMEISVKWTNPKLAADIANGYVEAYRDYVANSTTTIAKKHRLDVEQRLSQLQQRLSKAEADMSSFQSAHKSMDFPVESKALQGALLQLQVEKLSGKTLLISSKKFMEQQKRRLSHELTFYSTHPLVTSSLDDPVLESLRSQLADIYVRYAQAKATETSSNPEWKSYQAQLRATEAILRNQLSRRIRAREKGEGAEFIASQLKADLQETRNQALDSAIAQLEKKLSFYPGIAMDFLRKERKLKIMETLYTFLSSEREKAKLDEEKESPNFEVLDSAIPPDVPIGTHRLYGLLLGLFLAFILGVVGVNLVNYFSMSLLKSASLSSDGHPRHPDSDIEFSRKSK